MEYIFLFNGITFTNVKFLEFHVDTFCAYNFHGMIIQTHMCKFSTLNGYYYHLYWLQVPFIMVAYYHKILNSQVKERNNIACISDTPPNSLKDTNTNPKMITTEEEGIGVCSLICSTSKVRGVAWAFKWRLKWMTSMSIIHMDLHKPNNKLVSA